MIALLIESYIDQILIGLFVFIYGFISINLVSQPKKIFHLAGRQGVLDFDIEPDNDSKIFSALGSHKFLRILCACLCGVFYVLILVFNGITWESLLFMVFFSQLITSLKSISDDHTVSRKIMLNSMFVGLVLIISREITIYNYKLASVIGLAVMFILLIYAISVCLNKRGFSFIRPSVALLFSMHVFFVGITEFILALLVMLVLTLVLRVICSIIRIKPYEDKIYYISYVLAITFSFFWGTGFVKLFIDTFI